MGGRSFHPHWSKNEKLTLAAIAAFYLASVIVGLASNSLGGPGTDFMSFWSSGYLANTQGYRAVYNLETQFEIQSSINSGVTKYGVSPTAYFPVFVILFQPFALIPWKISFVVWTLANMVIFALYLKQRAGQLTPSIDLIAAFFSFYMYTNFSKSQIEVSGA